MLLASPEIVNSCGCSERSKEAVDGGSNRSKTDIAGFTGFTLV